MCSVMFTVCSNHLKKSQFCSFLKQAMLFLSPYNQYSLSTPLTQSMTAGKTTAVLLPMWWVCCNITPTSSLFTFTSIFNNGSWLRCHLSSTPHTHTHTHTHTHQPDLCGFTEGDKGSCGHQTKAGRVAWVLLVLYQSRIILYKPISMLLISRNTFMHEISNDVNV